MKALILSLAAIALAGCASHTGVVQTGVDTFMLAKQAATGFSGLGNMKAELFAEGGQHCRSMGKELQIVSTHETQPPYVFGNYPRAEITFMCLQPGDAALRRPALQKSPDTVIEMRGK